MSPETHQLVRRLFDEALERPEAERAAFLEAACAGNPEMLRQVNELLEARSQAGNFLQGQPDQPHHIGRYLVTGELGHGSMGIVYAAIDPLIGRTVAIKIIQLQASAGSADAAFLRDRLFREARSAGLLFHPGIAVILDVGQEGDVSFIAMERVDGPSLFQVLEKEGRIERVKAVSILRQTAAALDYAHGKGVIHRDIKPANIMLEKGVTVKVADFGIAKLTSAPQQTQTGVIMGTPSYMSPEQVDGKPLDGRSDQFSLAVVAYELLTGTRPFHADTVTALVHSIAYGPRPSASTANADLPATVDGVFTRALARLPGERFASCGDFVNALESALAAPAVLPIAPPPPARRRSIVPLAAGALVLLLAALGYFFRPASKPQPSRNVASHTTAPPPIPVITRFTADHAAIAAGASAALNWETSGAAGVSIEPGIGQVAAHGPLQVRPSKTTTYVLTATNPSGSVPAETTVVVTTPPAAADDAARGRQIFLIAQSKRRAGQSAQALVLFRQAADLGETRAMTELADSYLEEVNGVPKDSPEALRWIRKAADSGDATAMLQLGAFYDLGTYVPQDDRLAASWYRKAADRGSVPALFDLGKMYESGRGVSKDEEKARDYYRRAAALGDAEAKVRLARMPAH